MKIVCKLNNLCCAKCAADIQNKTSKLNGVKAACLGFMSQKLVVDVDDTKADALMDEIIKLVKKIEPDVVVNRVM
jgi:cation transport ATPase